MPKYKITIRKDEVIRLTNKRLTFIVDSVKKKNFFFSFIGLLLKEKLHVWSDGTCPLNVTRIMCPSKADSKIFYFISIFKEFKFFNFIARLRMSRQIERSIDITFSISGFSTGIPYFLKRITNRNKVFTF